MTKMNTYLRNLFVYFENVIHPAGGASESNSGKSKRKIKRSGEPNTFSPESVNLRAAKKQDKLRRNPAP